MTKEQEAIELAENFTKMDFSNPMGWTGYYDTELKELSQAIKTVLNMLKAQQRKIKTLTQTNRSYKGMIRKKDKEIEKLKVENENVWKLNANMSQRHLSDIFRIKKKDKQIDLMADCIDKTGAGRRAFSCTFRKNDECNENGCRYCIKQYFKEIAERKSKE